MLVVARWLIPCLPSLPVCVPRLLVAPGPIPVRLLRAHRADLFQDWLTFLSDLRGPAFGRNSEHLHSTIPCNGIRCETCTSLYLEATGWAVLVRLLSEMNCGICKHALAHFGETCGGLVVLPLERLQSEAKPISIDIPGGCSQLDGIDHAPAFGSGTGA